jgi:peptidoglycan/LPS O-acetylase OafA/YrhL
MSGIQYQARLDGLRFVAIFMVLLQHFAYYIGNKFSAGFYGVNLFFVISGFLITSILIRDTSNGFRKSYFKFLGRRALRIFPIYYLSILLFWFIDVEGIGMDFPYLLTYTYNYHFENTKTWSDIYSLYWSLCVEEQFYLFFPVIVLIIRKNRKLLLFTCFGSIFIALSQMYFNAFSLEKYNYTGLLTNMWPLTLGSLGAILHDTRTKDRAFFQNRYFEAVIIFLLLIVLLYAPFSIQFFICPLLSLYLVLKAYHYSYQLQVIEKFLSSKWIVFTGKISYGIYIYHSFISYYLSRYFFDAAWNKIAFEKLGILSKIEFHPWAFKLPLYTLISILTAYISYKVIEAPLLSLKDKLFATS